MKLKKQSPVEVSAELLRLVGRLRKHRTITTDEIEWLLDALLTTLFENTDLEGRLDWERHKAAKLEAELGKFKECAGFDCYLVGDGSQHKLAQGTPREIVARKHYHKEGK